MNTLEDGTWMFEKMIEQDTHITMEVVQYGTFRSFLVVYEGGFKKDRRHGEGTLTWSNGDKFTGTWSKGGRKGKGIFTTANGFQVKQVWNEGEDANYSKSIPEKFPKGSVPHGNS